MIETRLLHQFVVLAEELHFHRAAERLHMAQPPLTQAVRKLEEKVGARLFTRSNRHVALTEAGVAFLETAKACLANLEQGALRARRIEAGLTGRLAITFVGTARRDLVPLALRTFRFRFPDVELILREATTAKQIETLRGKQADIGFMRWPGGPADDIHFERIEREPVLAALPDDHPLATGAAIRLEQLAGEGFIMTPRNEGVSFHDQLIALCRHEGFEPRIAQEACEMQTVVGLVAGGLGVALVPASACEENRKGVVFCPIITAAPDELSHMDMVLGWRADIASPIRDSFVEVVRQVAKLDTQEVSIAHL